MRVYALTLLFGLLWFSPAYANTNTLTVEVVADTFIGLASLDPTHGTQPFLAVGRFDAYGQSRILLRFADFSLPQGAILTEATLQLWPYHTPPDSDVVVIRQITSAWDETAVWGSVTFDNTINYAEMIFPIHNGAPQLAEIALPLTLISSLTHGIMLRHLDESRPGTRLCAREIGGPCGSAHAPRLILRYNMNQPPTTPVLTAPAHVTQLCGTSTSLTWDAATDPDGTTPQYRVFWGSDHPPTHAEITSATQLTIPLQNATYYWQVEAFDTLGGISARSEIRQFTANCIPSAPQAIAPPDQGELCAPSIRFQWTPAQDQDQGALTYTLSLYGHDPREYRDLTIPEMTLNDLYGVYTWQVKATDAMGAVSELSALRQLTVNCPPATPVPLTPLPNAVICDQAIQFSWSGDTDPEHAPLTYRLTVNRQAQTSTYLIEDQTAFTLDQVGGEFTWQVEAIDPHGLTSAPSNLQIAIDNCAPTAPQLIAPADQTAFCAGSSQLMWQPAYDADLDPIAYRVYFGLANPPPLHTTLTAHTLNLPLTDRLYYWRIDAYDPLGFVGSSATHQFQIDCPNLIRDGGFEADQNRDMLPDEWRIIRRTRDRLICNTVDSAIAYSGICALMFQGGAGESAKLTQTIESPLLAGEVLVFSMRYRTNPITPRLRVIVTITYHDGSTSSVVSVINTPSNRVYTWFSLPPIALAQDAHTIQIVLHNRGAAGKVFLDDLRLARQPAP